MCLHGAHGPPVRRSDAWTAGSYSDRRAVAVAVEALESLVSDDAGEGAGAGEGECAVVYRRDGLCCVIGYGGEELELKSGVGLRADVGAVVRAWWRSGRGVDDEAKRCGLCRSPVLFTSCDPGLHGHVHGHEHERCPACLQWDDEDDVRIGTPWLEGEEVALRAPGDGLRVSELLGALDGHLWAVPRVGWAYRMNDAVEVCRPAFHKGAPKAEAEAEAKAEASARLESALARELGRTPDVHVYTLRTVLGGGRDRDEKAATTRKAHELSVFRAVFASSGRKRVVHLLQLSKDAWNQHLDWWETPEVPRVKVEYMPATNFEVPLHIRDVLGVATAAVAAAGRPATLALMPHVDTRRTSSAFGVMFDVDGEGNAVGMRERMLAARVSVDDLVADRSTLVCHIHGGEDSVVAFEAVRGEGWRMLTPMEGERRLLQRFDVRRRRTAPA